MQCFERVVALHAVKNLKFLPGIDHLVTGVLYVKMQSRCFSAARNKGAFAGAYGDT